VSNRFRIIILALVAAALMAPAADARHSAKKERAQAKALIATECADADVEPAKGNLKRIRAAILCLHNQIRARRHLPLLRQNRRLQRAAARHSRNMVADRFFEHTTPAGVTMVDRILRSRYVRSDQGWALGENLAWGTGALGTPRGAVDAWMASPGHRSNMLKRSYRELGVGIVEGVPVSDAAGATYTVDFGVRR
jgi:uncharacterized protein YkwD